MDREDAIRVLNQALEAVRPETYAQLVERVDAEPVHVDRSGAAGAIYQVEIFCMWDGAAGGDVRVFGSIDDGGWSAFSPLTRSFAKAPDGRFVGEDVAGTIEVPDMAIPVRFAKRVFQIAAVYGLVVLVPQYFMEDRIGLDSPPPITHPEYFYGFIGVAVAWQLVFLVIARDPIRYRMLMLPAILEKAGFGIPAIALYGTGRLNAQMLGAGLIDLTLGTLFLIAFMRTPGVGHASSGVLVDSKG